MRNSIACALLALAACGNAAADPDAEETLSSPSDVVVATANDMSSAALLKRTADDQKTVLAEAVRSTRNNCSSPIRAEYKGDGPAEAYWALKCEDGEYLVKLNAADSSPHVVTCEVAKSADLDCWKDW